MAERAEVPATVWMAEIQVGAENPGPSVQLQGSILQVNMVDSIRKFTKKTDRIHHLPEEVAGVKVKSKSLAILEGLESSSRRQNIERNLREMDLQAKLDTRFVEDI